MIKLSFNPITCHQIFGWDCLKELYPDLLNTGLEVIEEDHLYYVIKGGKIVNDTQFFTKPEVKKHCYLLYKYNVKHCMENNLFQTLDFNCWAENKNHAIEQCMDFYKDIKEGIVLFEVDKL